MMVVMYTQANVLCINSSNIFDTPIKMIPGNFYSSGLQH